MSLKNQVVFVQFHPVAYMVKLNIEMSMASLITKLARNSVADRNNEFVIESSSHNQSHIATQHTQSAIGMRSGVHTSAVGKMRTAHDDLEADFQGIRTFKEVDVKVESIPEEYRGNGSGSLSDFDDGFDRRKPGQLRDSDDELPLARPEVPKKVQGGWN